MICAHASLPPHVRNDHPLVIVGRPGWRCEETVRRLQALSDAGEPVHWLRRVESRDALKAIYHHALALSFVSLYEGFGIPVLEGFATRTPVITSTTSSLPEVAGDAAISVSPDDIEAIADAMARVAASSELRAELIVRGSRRVQEFTWAASAQKMAAIYARMR